MSCKTESETVLATQESITNNLVIQLLTEVEIEKISGGTNHSQGGNYTQSSGSYSQRGGTHSQTGGGDYAMSIA